jgi:hypothetical protein
MPTLGHTELVRMVAELCPLTSRALSATLGMVAIKIKSVITVFSDDRCALRCSMPTYAQVEGRAASSRTCVALCGVSCMLV